MKTIVLDTNIWLSELALMSPIGCAFSHYITVSGFNIGLPEVIELEAKYNFRKNLYEYSSKIMENYRKMLAIFGEMKEIKIPSDEDIEKKVEEVFDFHKDRIIRVPFDIDSARNSFLKIIKKEPPNSENNQQFKDGVIWANCLELAKSNDILLVTKDKAFFNKRNYDEGLAQNLIQEAQKMSNTITLFHELSDLLEDIKTPLKLKEDQIVKLIEKETYDEILGIAGRQEFDVETLINKTFEVFATTNPKEVSVKFTLKYKLKNKSSENRINPYAESRGEFLLNIESYTFKNFTNLGEHIFWTNENGELIERQNYYADLIAVIGHKTIQHEVSFKLK